MPEHCVEFGVHTPVQAPDTHAEAVQAAPAPHCPALVHVCTSLLEPHFTAPGAQTPVQAPETHAVFEHVVPSTQLPALQLCGVCPLHWVAPVVHCPQTPALHCRGHAVPFVQAPVELQVCGVSELHCFVPGAQTP